MGIYRNIGNWIGTHPTATAVLGGIIATVGAYNVGKWEARREPLVEKAVLLKEDLNNDGRHPDLAIQFLNGRREALYMQDNGSTFLSYPGMLKGYQEKEAILNGPLNSDKPAIPQSKPNPIDNPYIIPQHEPAKPTGPILNSDFYEPKKDPAIHNPNQYHPKSEERTAQTSSSNLEDMARLNLVPVIIPK